jgi:hypothetical protein
MAPGVVVAGLDPRELRLEVRFLQREAGQPRAVASIEELVSLVELGQAALVVIGGPLGERSMVDLVCALRAANAGRRASVLTIVPASEPPGTEGVLLGAGANAALRRPLERFVLESWVSKLADVPQRVQARIPVRVQVVGSGRATPGEHFYGLSRNLCVHGMLLASPVRVAAEDLDLELDLPEPEGRVRVLGRVAREAPEVGWPYVGYGIEFLFLPDPGRRAIERMVARAAAPAQGRSLWAPGAIHSTLRREQWVFEITEPARTEQGFLVEIRRAPREEWRPGRASPYHVVSAAEARAALQAAREFVLRHG